MPEFTGFVGGAYQAPSIYQNAQECINWYVEQDATKKPGDRGYMTLYPTPGLTPKFSLPAGEVRAMYVLPGGQTMLAVCNNIVYLVTATFTFTSVGTLGTSAGQVSIKDNRISAYLVDGPFRYSYTISSGTFLLISAGDGGFTGGDKVEYVDDFLLYNSPNSNLWGCTSALSTVSPNLSFTSKDSSSDNIVSLIADHREVLIIGETTTERWINVGAFPFPFQRIPGTSMQHGCAAKNSVVLLGESTAWISRDLAGQVVVIHMVGYQPQRISTHAVENDISSGIISDAIGFRYQQNGHEFYILTFPTQDKTWCFDIATQLWHKRAYLDNFDILHRHRANCYAAFQGLNLVGDYVNGQVYALDLNNYTDNGQPILRMRRTPHLTEGLNRIFYDFLQIQFMPGVGLSTGQGFDPQIMLRWSNDGGSTWSSYSTLAIGKQGMYQNRAIKRQMGFARDRIYEVTITDPVNAVILSAQLDTSDGDD